QQGARRAGLGEARRTGRRRAACFEGAVGAVSIGIREMAMAKAEAKSSAQTAARRRPSRRVAAPSKTKARLRAKPRPQHSFVASHHREEDFKVGLRRYAKYRDLGMSKATKGMVQAHVVRFVPPCRPEEVSKLHFHDVEFQMVYVL